MRFNDFSRLKQAGISLLEVLLSVGIIAVILVMATTLYYQASNDQMVNILNSNMGALSSAEIRYNMNNAGGPSGGGFTSDVNTLVNNGYLSANVAKCDANSSPATTAYTNCNVPNPFGQIITVDASAGKSVTLSATVNSLATCNLINQQQGADMHCDTSNPYVVTKMVGVQ